MTEEVDSKKVCPLSNLHIDEEISFEDKFSESYLVNYAVKHAIEDMSNYYVRPEEFASFFENGRLISIWNAFPEHRQTILDSFVIPRRIPWNLDKDASSSMMEQYKAIAISVHDTVKDSYALSDSYMRVGLSGILGINHDFKAICEHLIESEDPHNSLEYWRKIGLDRSDDPEFFEFAYFSIKRAPGSTELKKEVINRASAKRALSSKIIEAIAKSSPITLKRSIVSQLCGELWDVRRDIKSIERKMIAKGLSVEEVEEMKSSLKESVDKIQEKLILFAPVVDREVQRSLVDNVCKENLVWLVPAVSRLKGSWLSGRLESRMENSVV